MDITEAMTTLNDFIQAYEIYCDALYANKTKPKDELIHVTKEYFATKVLIDEYINLRKELVTLSCESVKRDLQLTKMEMTLKSLIRHWRKDKSKTPKKG